MTRMPFAHTTTGAEEFTDFPRTSRSGHHFVGVNKMIPAGVVYLSEDARFAHLLSLPEGANIGQAVNEAMRAIEKENPDLSDVLPKSYHILDSRRVSEPTLHSIRTNDEWHVIKQKWLEHPCSRPCTERLAPCYLPTKSALTTCHSSNDLTVVSSKKGDNKVPTPYEDLQDSVGRFDFVLALPNAAARSLPRSHPAERAGGRINPPFNVSKIDKERLAGNPRYPFGIPRTDNGNYLGIQHFHFALNKKGRAGFVMVIPPFNLKKCSDTKVGGKLVRKSLPTASGWCN